MTDRPEFEEDAWEPYREPEPDTCGYIWVAGLKLMQCDEPCDARDSGIYCTKHAIQVCREILKDSIADGDYESARLTLDDLKSLGVNEELAMAA